MLPHAAAAPSVMTCSDYVAGDKHVFHASRVGAAAGGGTLEHSALAASVRLEVHDSYTDPEPSPSDA